MLDYVLVLVNTNYAEYYAGIMHTSLALDKQLNHVD